MLRTFVFDKEIEKNTCPKKVAIPCNGMPSKSWPIHVYLMTLLEKSMTLGVTQMLQ